MAIPISHLKLIIVLFLSLSSAIYSAISGRVPLSTVHYGELWLHRRAFRAPQLTCVKNVINDIQTTTLRRTGYREGDTAILSGSHSYTMPVSTNSLNSIYKFVNVMY